MPRQDPPAANGHLVAGSREPYRACVGERLAAAEKLARAVAHLNDGGKATRARCVQLVGQAFEADEASSELERFAEAVELLHLGTLIHDDILDDAERRRGRPAVHVEYGAKVAVLAGDVAVSRSGCLIADFGSPRLSRRFAEVLAELCEGELLQDDQRWDPGLTLPAYLDRLAKKTGGLFELACEGAAVLAGAAGPAADRAGRFGRDLGCLFQLVDDLLDETGDSTGLGKPAGRDLAAGCLTLKAVLALADSGSGPPLRAQLADPRNFGMDRLETWLAAPAVQAGARSVLEAMGALTLEGLDVFAPSSARLQLQGLVEGLQATGLAAIAATVELPRMGRP